MYNILVVDDEELERKVLVFTLENSGLPIDIVGEASSGREAIEIAQRTSPDIVFMDIKMPGIDGLEATKQIKAENPATEIIILTAYGKFSYSQQALKAQATDYLLKPTHPLQLIEATSKAIARLDSKRFRAGPTLDMSGFEEQVRLGSLSEAKHALNCLVAKLRDQGTGSFPAQINSFGFKLLVFAIQALMDNGADPAWVNGLERKFVSELSGVTSLADLERWGGQMLDSLLSLNFSQAKSQEHQVVAKAKEYMAKNYRENLSLHIVAAQVHLSPSYLSRIFTRNTGMNFTDYLTNIRLKEAKHRLATSQETIDQIATEIGFCSNSYFTAVFKKKVGVTPSEFRVKHQV